MCTVSFLPKGKSDFILSSNRDEQKKRPRAQPPRKYDINGTAVFYPRDMQAMGTWIACAENFFTLCLLNGAFEKHRPQPPYAKSRGLMLLDFFQYNQVEAFASQYDFNGIEPFTLIIVSAREGVNLHELVWDGQKLHLQLMNSQEPHIWSSSTLYTDAVRAERRLWFHAWLRTQTEFNKDAAMQFHRFGGNGDLENSLVMNRHEQVLTVSITSIEKISNTLSMTYADLLQPSDNNYRLIF